jgi:hypothetical protein
MQKWLCYPEADDFLRMVPDKNLEHAGSAIIASLRPIPNKVHAIIFNNGWEFSDHAR